MTIADFATVIVTTGLLIVTGVYTYFTAAQVRPYLQSGIVYHKSDTLFFVIQNTGKGAAHDVYAEWRVPEDDGGKREWRSEIIPAGEQRRFAIPLGGTERHYTSIADVREALDNSDGEGEIEFRASCTPLAGLRMHFCQTISIENAIHRISHAEEYPTLAPMEGIEESLHEIEDAVRNL